MATDSPSSARITNQQFADATGLHFTMASRLRSGQRRPSIRTLQRIATVYGLPIQELIDQYNAGRSDPADPNSPYAIGLFLAEKIFGDDISEGVPAGTPDDSAPGVISE